MRRTGYRLAFLVDQYLTELMVNNKSPHTVKNFSRVLREFQQFVQSTGGPDSGEAISPGIVREFQKHLRENKKNRPSSVRSKIQVLKAWTAYLTRAGVFRRDPLAGHRLLPTAGRQLPRSLDPDDLQRVGDSFDSATAIGARNLAIVSLLIDTGVRVSELAALTLADIDFQRCLIKVRGKGAKERYVAFGRITRQRLRHYIDYHRQALVEGNAGEDENRVFLCHGGVNPAKGSRVCIGTPLSAHGIQQVFGRLQHKLGISVSAHRFRHTFSAEFLKAGGTVADLQSLLGHETPAMSLRYAQVFNSDAVNRQRSNSIVDRLRLGTARR